MFELQPTANRNADAHDGGAWPRVGRKGSREKKKIDTLFAVTAMFLATASVYAQAPWTPEFTNTVAWFDANDSGTLWEDTNGTIQATTAVARMDDKSGNLRHMTQGSGSLQMSVSNNYLYGEEFGSHQGQWMDTAEYSGQSSNLMLFIVAKVTGADNGSDALWSFRGLGGAGSLSSKANAPGAFTHGFDGVSALNSSTNDYYNQLAIFELKMDWDGINKVQSIVNDVQNMGDRNYNAPLDSTVKLHLFNNRDLNRPLGGLFGEWVLVDGVDEDLEDTIQGYQSPKMYHSIWCEQALHIARDGKQCGKKPVCGPRV